MIVAVCKKSDPDHQVTNLSDSDEHCSGPSLAATKLGILALHSQTRTRRPPHALSQHNSGVDKNCAYGGHGES